MFQYSYIAQAKLENNYVEKIEKEDYMNAIEIKDNKENSQAPLIEDMYYNTYTLNSLILTNSNYLDINKVLRANLLFRELNDFSLKLLRKQLELGNYLKNRKSVSVNMLYSYNKV